jgi:hypothetical protein
MGAQMAEEAAGREGESTRGMAAPQGAAVSLGRWTIVCFIFEYFCEHNSHLLCVLLVRWPRQNKNEVSRLHYHCRDEVQMDQPVCCWKPIIIA